MPGPDPDNDAPGRFATTCWTLVLAAKDRGSPQAREALSDLCRAYWYPLYAYIRRRGHDADQAQDLTQEFFARLLEERFLGTVEPTKGKFRSFLLAACNHFLANERDRREARKRGGDRGFLSIDARDAEDRYRLEVAHDLTPMRLFERRWALTLLGQALERLRREYHRTGRGDLFERLKPTLTGDPQRTPYADLAVDLDMTVGAVQVAAHRLRRRYRDVLREQIAGTLDDPARVDDEIRDLFAALGT